MIILWDESKSSAAANDTVSLIINDSQQCMRTNRHKAESHAQVNAGDLQNNPLIEQVSQLISIHHRGR